MKGSQSHEFETDVPASELWEIYGTLRPAELLPELLPHILAKAELVSGDGGVGTIVQLTFPPGIPGLQGYKEKYIKVDNENYIKEAEAIDGDILKLGFLSYMIRLEIIGKGPNSSVIRSTIEYEIDDGNAELESMISTAPLAATAEILGTRVVRSLSRPQRAHESNGREPLPRCGTVYGGLLVGQLIPQLLPGMFSKVELVEGDGGVGTVLLVTFPPGTPGLDFFQEKFIKVDNENYVKEAKVTEGGFLDHGFQKYLVRIEIIAKTDKTSIIRSTIEYEVDDEHTSNASFVSTSGVATIAEAITKYIKEQKSAE